MTHAIVTGRYRIECVDRETGETTYHVFDAANSDAARELATRLGYIVGRVTGEPTPELRGVTHDKATKRWVWFAGGVTVGALLACAVAVSLLVMGVIGVRDQVETAMTAVRGSVARAMGVDEEADKRWNKRWPTLKFPDRSPSGLARGVGVRYDEFDDRTTISFDFELSGFGAMVYGLTSCEGKCETLQAPPRTVLIGVVGSLNTYEELAFIADGVRIRPSKSLGAQRIETESLLTIARSQRARVRAGESEYELTEQHKKVLSDFLSLLHP